MSDFKYKMIAIPSDRSVVYLSVRLWSANGKAVEQINNELKNLNGYSLASSDFDKLYSLIRQKVKDAQATSKSKYAICMDERMNMTIMEINARPYKYYSLSFIATIYAMPMSGVIAFNASLEEEGGEA